MNSNPDDLLEAWVVDPIGERIVLSCFRIETCKCKVLNPEPMFGSFGLDSTHCFDRSGRLRLYGFDTVADRFILQTSVSSDVEWGRPQAHCGEANKARFSNSPGQNLVLSYTEIKRSLSLRRNTILYIGK